MCRFKLEVHLQDTGSLIDINENVEGFFAYFKVKKSAHRHECIETRVVAKKTLAEFIEANSIVSAYLGPLTYKRGEMSKQKTKESYHYETDQGIIAINK